MAYHPTNERSPFIDTQLQSKLARRGVELLGLVLIGLGILISMTVWSYSPDDPSWLSATDSPIQNMLGVTGASFAAPIILILGWSSWAFAALSAIWGLRCLLHKGAQNAFWRLVFAPFAVALLALYCASLVPPSIWTHSFGMGGLFGDTILHQFLSIMPFDDQLNITSISFLTGLSFVAIMLYCLGFTGQELNCFISFLSSGLVNSFTLLFKKPGQGSSGYPSVVKTHNDVKIEAGECQNQSVMEETEHATFQLRSRLSLPPAPEMSKEVQSLYEVGKIKEKRGLLTLLLPFLRRSEKSIRRRSGEDFQVSLQSEVTGDQRIRAKISDVIKSRVSHSSALLVNTEKMEEEIEEPLNSTSADARVEPFVSTKIQRFDANAAEKNRFDQLNDTVPQEIKQEPSCFPEPFINPLKTQHKKVVHPSARKPLLPSSRAKKEAQPSLQFEDKGISYELPPLSLLSHPTIVERQNLSDESLEENARLLESVLDDYGVRGEIVSVRPGPVVTMYELEPAPGLKASRVIGLSDDIARSMSALSARVSTIPGKTVIGIELPNERRERVVLREILSSKFFGDGNQKLPIALGKDIGGEPVVANLAKMPHLLIAGTTGSGKSVAINTMILSLLYKLTPEECRLIMIDPKMLELSVYDGIPHLLSPVVTDPKKAVVALKWVVGEMEERYRSMSKMGVRNIDGYNGRVEDTLARGEMFSRTIQIGFDDQTGEPIFETEKFAPEKMPFIVVIVDEMADLMMVSGKEIEACIQRLAQMARASGIHLIMATQRPSVDVITGTIKANFPTRVSFQVTSKIDSRTILGEMGAEQLLGMGDMLYMAGGSKISRCHGPFVSDEEVEEVVSHLKFYGPPEYKSGVIDGPEDDAMDNIDLVLGIGGNSDAGDALYDQAVAIVLRDRKCSTSYIQRKLAIGYNKAARLVEQMEDEGLVTSANHVGKREILIPEQQ